MNFIVDKEINLSNSPQGTSRDLLHTKRYADILLQCVKDAPKNEPYTIGLFGEWGSGKSSVIKTMTESITSDTELKKVKVVNYDAWKYSGDSFRRMFLYELRQALGMGESPLMQRFYVNEIHETKIKTSLNWKKLGIVIAFVVLSIIAVWVINSILGKEVAIPSTIALVALLFSLCSFIFDQLKISVNKPLLFAPEQFEECFKEMVSCATKWDKYKEKALRWITLGIHQLQYLRLVIIVDNIDRCQADKAYTLLTDIKNFLCNEFDAIFIVPVDIEALRKHIIKSSSDYHSLEADEFLRKFFNTSVWMKQYQNDEMFDFANNIAQRNSLGFKPDTVSLVANEFATNPRRIIQLFNNLQIELYGYDPAFAKEHQALICKMLIIREEFPAFQKQLLSDPSKLFVDIQEVRNKANNNRTDFEKAILSDSRLTAFLIASAGISARYSQREDVVAQILVNTQIKNSLPENIRQAYRSVESEVLMAFAQDAKKRELLINYLQDNIKKMTRRGTYDAEGKVHLEVLLFLFEKGLLSIEDKSRLMSPLFSPNILSKCIGLFDDKSSLIRLGVDLEKIQLSKLSAMICSYFKGKYSTMQEFSNTDILNIYFAASVWDVESCKKIEDVFFKVLQTDPVSCRQYEYDRVKHSTLFSETVFNYLFENMNAETCNDDKSAIQTFRYLCHLQAVNTANLLLFINKAIEIAPSFDRSKPQKSGPTSFLKVLSEIFNESRYQGRVVPHVTMTRLFDKINAAGTVTANRNTTANHSYVKDNASDECCADIVGQFFTNVNLITDGPVVSNAEIEHFMKVENNRDRMLNSMMYLKTQGIDTSTWTNAIITDPRRTDVRRVELLKFAFVEKNYNGEYKVNEDVVKREITELINVIQAKSEDVSLIVEMLMDILDDERIDRIIREILSQKTLDEQKQLPIELMQRAVASFEHNINALNIPGDTNVLQLIASKGSDDSIEGVWGRLNPILADGKNQPQSIINSAIDILLSFSKLSKAQSDALAGNLNTLPAAKLDDDRRKEVLGFLMKFQS